MIESTQENLAVIRELEDLRARVQELEDSELQRVSDEQERFDSLQVLDEYAKQLEESRDKLMRLFKAAANVQEAKSIQDALEKVADAVKEAGWSSVTVGLYDNYDIVQSAYAGCTPAEIEFLETHRRPSADRARMYSPEFDCFKISRSYFIPADRLTEIMSPENICPGRREVQPGDDWDPMDLAYVPLYGSNGDVIGSINCDDPVDGHRPTRDVFFYLELFAELVARKVETARLIDQQHRTEEALRQSEELYRTVFNRSGDGFFTMDHLFIDCNEKACELFGCDRDDIVGHSPVRFSPEYQADGRPSLAAAEEFITRALSGVPQSFEWAHKRLDGTMIDCEVSLSPLRVGERNLAFAVVRDVTNRRGAERALRQSEERFRRVFEHSPIGMTVSAADGRYLNVNSAFCQILGYSADEIAGKSFAEVTHPDDLPESFSALAQLVSGDADNLVLEKRYVHKAGNPVWASVNIAVLRDQDSGLFLVTQVQDITERKRAELERETIVRILQIANEVTHADEMIDGIFNEVGRLVPAENRFLAQYDAEKELISFPYFVDEMDSPPSPVPLGRGLTSWVIRNGRSLRLGQADFERLTRTGEIEQLGSPAFSWLGVPLITNSKVIGALVVQTYKSVVQFDAEHERILMAVAAQIASVIERQRSEESLLKLKRAVQAAGDVIFMTDKDGTITYANPEFARLYGYQNEEIVGKVTPRILKSGLTASRVYDDFWRKLTHGELIKGELLNRAKDGRLVAVEASANPIMDENDKIIGYLGTQRDITARKNTEERIRKLNECFLNFGAEPIENINRLVEVCGEMLGAACAVYNCREGDYLRAVGQWRTPPHFVSRDRAVGLVCFDTLNQPGDDLFVVHNLGETDYTTSDALVAESAFHTYVGTKVRCAEDVVGSLCVFFDGDYNPSDEDHKMMGIVAAAIGVEEVRRRSEFALRDSEDRFRQLYARAPLAYQSLDANGCFLDVNELWLDNLGYTREDVIGRWFGEFLCAEAVDCFRTQFPKFLRAGEVHNVEFDMRRKDGTIISVSFEGRIARDSVGNFRQTHCIMRDVTQQKRAQADLLKKTNELQAIFRALPDLYFRVDREGTILDYQAGKSSDLYTTPENFLQKKFADVLPAGVGQKFSDAIADVASSGDLKTIEYDLTIGSELAHFEARIMPLADGQFIVVVRNVTETRQTTSALRESEQRFWTLADTVPVMIWMTGVDKRFIFVNRGWSEFSGYSLEQARGQAWPIDVHPDDLKRTIATFKTACDARIDFSVQCRMKRKDGGYRWVIQNGRPRFTSSGRFVGYIGTCTDVSSQMTEDGDIE